MEERVPLPADTTAAAPDEPPLPPLDEPPLPPLKPPPGSETYVVRIPKDQIYRVPPPENALIAERFRNPPRQKNCNHRCRWVLFVFLALIILAVAIGIIVGVLYKYLNPKGPQFSIQEVTARTYKSSSRDQHFSRVEYEISLKANNPNERMGIDYGKNGDVLLSFKQQEIGTGKYPSFYQEEKNSTIAHLVLAAKTAAVPDEVEKSLKDKKSDVKLDLALRIVVPMRMKFGFLSTWEMKMEVNCDFKVSPLAAGTRVLSQECRTG